MIDFRYHLVSIIAVFLALAVGLVVGSTALSGKAVEALSAAQRAALANNHALTKDKNQLQKQVSADQAFAAASSGRLLAGLLTGERVVLVTAPGADGAIATGLTTALRQAGATVTGQVSLTSAFMTSSGQNEATLSQLAQTLAGKAGLSLTAAGTSDVPGQLAAAQVLAASLVTSSAVLTASASKAILTGLSQGGFLSVASGAPAAAPADLAVLVIPAGPPQSKSDNDVLVTVAQQLRAAGSETVMAGAVSSIGSGSAISAEKSAGNVVSTVDNADTETGQIMVVQALRYLLNGKSPLAYGIGSGVAPSPAPTPAASATTKPSAATAKGHG